VEIFPLGEIQQKRRAVIRNGSDAESDFPVGFLLLSQLDELSLAEGSPVG
jgi:hypothetical protein